MGSRLYTEERGIDYDMLCLLATSSAAEGLSYLKGSPATWLDLAIDYALSFERTIRGKKELRLTAKEAAEIIRVYFGEKAYRHLPTGRELSSAIRDHERLRKICSTTGGK